MGQFGQELRQEREGRGVSVDEICAVTKVSVRHLEALEAGRYEELPGGVFRKGIVRSYISAVGLEEAPWIERFEMSLRERGMAESVEPDWAEFAENVKKNRGKAGPATGLRWLGVALMLILLLVGGWLTWKYVLHGRLALSAAPNVPVWCDSTERTRMV
ncbi:helix-turn-helix domain-containing protein [Granulicella arctica]|uniref:Cytoskeletal protein RodZ n=1 Tax=Granulicella arctica TaxID=940613 RepID=A0A7Y9TFX1_9BACT|nr:helix-turn-helix domain-containing protein [Granulicella arctica]NYF79256.1 cytoskeletal protein RodZ [Granulicella arctica]